MGKKLRWAIIIAAALLFIVPAPACAAIPNPISVSLYDISVYRDLIVDEDWLAVVPYSITFTTEPEVSIDKTFIFRLIDNDGVTEWGAVLAFPYINRGYGDGVVSFYFSADDAPAWDTQYTIRVDENPSQYAGPLTWNFTLSVSAYSSYDTQEGNRALLQSEVIAIARDLEVSWGIEMLGESDVSTVLGDYGEAYFRNAIYGLQNMCPSLFSVEIVPLTPSNKVWSNTFADAFATKYSGTWWGDAMTGFGGLLNVETSSAASLMSLVLIVAVVGLSIWKGKATTNSGFLHGFASVGLFTLLGAFSFTIHGLVAFLCMVAAAMVLFFMK